MDCARAKDLLDYLEHTREQSLELIERLVCAESPSTVPEAQVGVQHILEEALDEQGFRVRRLSSRDYGGHLYAVPRGRSHGKPAQLLLGHCDTVWPLGILATMPLVRDGEYLRGPGVFDMKAGLVQMVSALRALRYLGLETSVDPVVFVNSDEEVGSLESRRHIARLARAVDRALVLEPALGPAGRLKTARKGVGRFTIRVQGKAAHAGLDPQAGASAILELSHVIQKLFALNDAARGISVNVGLVEGGLRPNVVAPESTATADVRVPTAEDARRIEEAIFALEASTPGVSLKVEGRFGRPPLEPTPGNRALWTVAQNAATVLGFELQEGMAGGGSDGNTTSLYTPTLDGLGAVGDGAHAPHEFMSIAKLTQRTALLALLLLAPPMKTGRHRAVPVAGEA